MRRDNDARRSVLMNSIRFHWQRGKHSGFPACDRVWFFVRLYSGWTKLAGSRFGYPLWIRFTHFMDRFAPEWTTEEDQGYVRCPVCVIRRRFVYVHSCDNECVGKTGVCL
jgi:hypothetical protein